MGAQRKRSVCGGYGRLTWRPFPGYLQPGGNGLQVVYCVEWDVSGGHWPTGGP
uniref:Uncharacterized protein n=1 Tax=Anguilla anguilla TaxID=7936 RepID=A0A0E9PI16_ANGAN